MTYQAEGPRVAIRAVLHTAGLITEVGEVRGAEADRPDARLLALIAEHELSWGTYVSMCDKTPKQKFERPIRHALHAKAEAVLEQIHTIRAVTPEGVRAKATLVIEHVASGIDRVASSAIADALRAATPRAAPFRRGRGRQKEAPAPFTAPDDEPLFQLIADYKHVRKLARADEVCGENLSAERFAWAKTYVKIADELARTPAQTGPGIAAKLEAGLPSLDSCRRWSRVALIRSAMIDLLEVGLSTDRPALQRGEI